MLPFGSKKLGALALLASQTESAVVRTLSGCQTLTSDDYNYNLYATDSDAGTESIRLGVKWGGDLQLVDRGYLKLTYGQD